MVVKIRNKCVIFDNDTSLLLVARWRDKCRASRLEVKKLNGSGTSWDELSFTRAGQRMFWKRVFRGYVSVSTGAVFILCSTYNVTRRRRNTRRGSLCLCIIFYDRRVIQMLENYTNQFHP